MIPMDEVIFKTALSAVSSGEYGEADLRAVKEWLESLNKKEAAIKRQLEKNKNEFVKRKDKTSSELKNLRNDIKTIKSILKRA